MSNIPTNFLEFKHIYDFEVSPKTYYYDTDNKTIHSGKRYKYKEITHYTYDYDISSIYLYNCDNNCGKLHLCSFSCSNPETKKKKSYNFEYNILINDIEKNPEWFFD